MIRVPRLPVAALVELVNGWGTVPRARGGERPCPPAAEFAARHPALRPPGGELDDNLLESAADAAYPVFATTDAQAKALFVTALLEQVGVRPAVTVEGADLRATWLVPRHEDALAASVALGVYEQLLAGAARLGTCASSTCGDVYVDASPGAHRRFCSLTCQNRERVAAFRRRRAADADS
jgi:predicted RNA-binding Zn ribbon-like protein